MAIGIGIGLPFRKTLVGIPFASDLAMRVTSRSGITLVDELGNNSSILPAYLYKPNTTLDMHCNDGGALSVGTNSLVLSCWVKGESATISQVGYVCGKAVTGVVNGKYYFYIGTDGTYRATIQPSGGIKTITSTVNAKDLAWHNLIMVIDNTAKVFKFFIDNVQIGSDTAFTGTFSTLGDSYPFCIGTGTGVDGNVRQCPALVSLSDVVLYDRLLTPTELTGLFNRTIAATPKAYFPLLGTSNTYEWDASGNGYHITVLNEENQTDRKLFYKYSAYGSTWGLDKGFTLYKNGQGYSYIPYDMNGIALVNPPLPIGATKLSEHPGNLTKVNLANCLININNVHWDRSNATIWSWAARSSETFYDSSITNGWHTSELNNHRIAEWANSGHKAKGFVKITDHSYKDRKVLDELFTYTTDHYSSGYSSIIASHCKDYNPTDGIYENDYLYWKYDSRKILATRGNKVLMHNANVIMLSIDGGITFPYTKLVAAFSASACFGYIWENGNLSFATRNKIYSSTDNLATVNEVIPTGIDGKPFVATTDAYYDVNGADYMYVGGTEVKVWGTYSTVSPTEFNNIDVWISDDAGVSIKSIFRFGVTLPAYSCRHIHSVTQNPDDESFIMNTGDGQFGCNWFRGVYDINTHTANWAFYAGKDGTIVSTVFCNSPYKTGGIGFYGDYAYWHSDGNDNRMFGTYRALKTELTDNTKATRIYPTMLQIGCAVFQRNGKALLSDGQPNIVHHTSDSCASIKTSNLFGLPQNIGLLIVHPENTDGWMAVKILLSTETSYVAVNGGICWIKLK